MEEAARAFFADVELRSRVQFVYHSGRKPGSTHQVRYIHDLKKAYPQIYVREPAPNLPLLEPGGGLPG